MDIKDHAPTVEKGLLDLPADLMYEVFGPLDARSLCETANSHPILRKHVALWPGKKWEVVHRSGGTNIIDYETFDDRDAELLLKDPRFNKELFDLPYDLLLPILKPLAVYDMLSVAKCHPNLVRATTNLKGKRFQKVECFPEQVECSVLLGDCRRWSYRDGLTWTPGEADFLLADAFVVDLLYDVQTPIAPNMSVDQLIFQGLQENADKCAGLIEKWQPKKVVFPLWSAEAFNSNPELPRVLKNVERLEIGAVTVEWLSYIPEWKFTTLKILLDAKGENVTPQLALMCQQLYAQWMEGKLGGIALVIKIGRGIVDSFEVGGKSVGPRTRNIFDDGYSRVLRCEMPRDSLLRIVDVPDDWMYDEDDSDFDSDFD